MEAGMKSFSALSDHERTPLLDSFQTPIPVQSSEEESKTREASTYVCAGMDTGTAPNRNYGAMDAGLNGGKCSAPIQEQDRNDSTTATAVVYPSPHATSPWIRAPQKGCCKCSRSNVVLLFLLLSILVVALGLAIGLLIPGIIYACNSTERTVPIRQGDTVLLDRVGGFYYESLTFTETSNPSDPHEVSIYTESCNNLTVHNDTLLHNSPILPGLTDPYAILRDKYLVSRSNLSLMLTTWNASDPASGKVCIFDDINWFQHFLSGKGLEHYVKCFEVTLDPGNHHVMNIISYTFTKTSYYYVVITVDSPSPVYLQYNTTLFKKSYNSSDYTPKECHAVLSKDGCTIDLQWDIAFDAKEHCILGFTPVPPIAELEYVHLKEDIHPRSFNTFLLSFVVFVSLCIITVSVCIIALLLYLKWKRKAQK